MAYLNRKHDGKLGVLWIDAHPDVMSAAEFSHAHAHVLGMLLGRGDEEFTAEVDRKLNPSRVSSEARPGTPLQLELVGGITAERALFSSSREQLMRSAPDEKATHQGERR